MVVDLGHLVAELGDDGLELGAVITKLGSVPEVDDSEAAEAPLDQDHHAPLLWRC